MYNVYRKFAKLRMNIILALKENLVQPLQIFK